jgi:hypothetical protein
MHYILCNRNKYSFIFSMTCENKYIRGIDIVFYIFGRRYIWKKIYLGIIYFLLKYWNINQSQNVTHRYIGNTIFSESISRFFQCLAENDAIKFKYFISCECPITFCLKPLKSCKCPKSVISSLQVKSGMQYFNSASWICQMVHVTDSKA